MGDSFTAYLNGHPFCPLSRTGSYCANLMQARNGAERVLSQSTAVRVDVFRNGAFKGEVRRTRLPFSKENTYSYTGYV
ncbi:MULTISPECIES: hypothetical protein [Salinimonas]|uniref:Uncharacterized protein n=2 Tax=Salinimonas TaxID=288793 RepID=A0A5B7YJ17_9ALTE|nr:MULTISPECIES: hypothetical protein [Salinimonas]MBD3587533.1 hypothetical protein [Salinimonas profundi]QCZ95554.1 hypothetical protein FBQ74_18715 [Salinimonas iocasae]